MDISQEYIDALIARLPRGSGFDSPWEYIRTTGKGGICLRGGYHYMNPNGYYDGWCVVNLRVQYTGGSALLPADWRVTLGTDAVSRRVQRRDPGLREYIEDTIHEALRG